jgi:hypothetical protein
MLKEITVKYNEKLKLTSQNTSKEENDFIFNYCEELIEIFIKEGYDKNTFTFSINNFEKQKRKITNHCDKYYIFRYGISLEHSNKPDYYCSYPLRMHRHLFDCIDQNVIENFVNNNGFNLDSLYLRFKLSKNVQSLLELYFNDDEKNRDKYINYIEKITINDNSIYPILDIAFQLKLSIFKHTCEINKECASIYKYTMLSKCFNYRINEFKTIINIFTFDDYYSNLFIFTKCAEIGKDFLSVLIKEPSFYELIESLVVSKKLINYIDNNDMIQYIESFINIKNF